MYNMSVFYQLLRKLQCFCSCTNCTAKDRKSANAYDDTIQLYNRQLNLPDPLSKTFLRQLFSTSTGCFIFISQMNVYISFSILYIENSISQYGFRNNALNLTNTSRSYIIRNVNYTIQNLLIKLFQFNLFKLKYQKNSKNYLIFV